MILYFYDLNQYKTYSQARHAGALRELYVDEPSFFDRQTSDIVEAVIEAATMIDGNARVAFVLTDDTGKVLDVLGVWNEKI